MSCIFTKHAYQRLVYRNFDRETIERIIKDPEMVFYDYLTKSFVAVSVVSYANKNRYISVFYHVEKEVKVIRTFHPENLHEIQSRVRTKRYILITEYEKKLR